MKVSGLVFIAIVLSIAQAYAAYLLHNDRVQMEVLQWLIAVFYLPLYFILLLIAVFIESIFGVHLFNGGVIFPYLDDVLWAAGAAMLYPLNLWFLKWIWRRKQRA